MYTTPFYAQLDNLDEPIVSVYKQLNPMESVKIGEYKTVFFKNKQVHFYPFKIDNCWYGLVGVRSNIYVYDLSNFTLIAEHLTTKEFYEFDIWEFYIPRFYTYKIKINAINDEAVVTLVDDDIPNDCSENDWQHANFAFVSSYDTYSNGPNYLSLLDLSAIKSGLLSYKHKYFAETPEWMPLTTCLRLNNYSEDCPFFEVAKYSLCSVLTCTECGPEGWTAEQLGYK